MKRIKNADLEYLVKQINEKTESPMEYSTLLDNGERVTNKGHYHLDMAYGGVKLVRTDGVHGGIREISTTGYGTKRELYNWMRAFLSGLYT